MTLERERAMCQQWRQQQVDYAAAGARNVHPVDSCRCWVCVLCRALETTLVEVDRLTGPESVGSGGVPGGV